MSQYRMMGALLRLGPTAAISPVTKPVVSGRACSAAGMGGRVVGLLRWWSGTHQRRAGCHAGRAGAGSTEAASVLSLLQRNTVIRQLAGAAQAADWQQTSGGKQA